MWDSLEGINAGVTVFNTDFKDKITEVRTCDIKQGDKECLAGNTSYNFISDRVNVDKANMRGVEATFGWQINKDWKWNTNYTYTASEQKGGEFQGRRSTRCRSICSTPCWTGRPRRTSACGRALTSAAASDYLSRTSMETSTPSSPLSMGPELSGGEKPAVDRRGLYNILRQNPWITIYRTTLDGRRYRRHDLQLLMPLGARSALSIPSP